MTLEQIIEEIKRTNTQKNFKRIAWCCKYAFYDSVVLVCSEDWYTLTEEDKQASDWLFMSEKDPCFNCLD